MALLLNNFTNNVQLGQYAHSTNATALYQANVQLFGLLPGNSVSIQMLKNSTVIVTSAAPSSDQTHMELSSGIISATAGDAINVNITSPQASDNLPNKVHGTIQIQKINNP